VMIRYKGPARATGGTITTPVVDSVEYTVHTFLASGTFLWNG
jgi:hypothetical protein